MRASSVCRPDSATQDAVLKFLKFSVSVALIRRLRFLTFLRFSVYCTIYKMNQFLRFLRFLRFSHCKVTKVRPSSLMWPVPNALAIPSFNSAVIQAVPTHGKVNADGGENPLQPQPWCQEPRPATQSEGGRQGTLFSVQRLLPSAELTQDSTVQLAAKQQKTATTHKLQLSLLLIYGAHYEGLKGWLKGRDKGEA